MNKNNFIVYSALLISFLFAIVLPINILARGNSIFNAGAGLTQLLVYTSFLYFIFLLILKYKFSKYILSSSKTLLITMTSCLVASRITAYFDKSDNGKYMLMVIFILILFLFLVMVANMLIVVFQIVNDRRGQIEMMIRNTRFFSNFFNL